MFDYWVPDFEQNRGKKKPKQIASANILFPGCYQ